MPVIATQGVSPLGNQFAARPLRFDSVGTVALSLLLGQQPDQRILIVRNDSSNWEIREMSEANVTAMKLAFPVPVQVEVEKVGSKTKTFAVSGLPIFLSPVSMSTQRFIEKVMEAKDNADLDGSSGETFSSTTGILIDQVNRETFFVDAVAIGLGNSGDVIVTATDGGGYLED